MNAAHFHLLLNHIPVLGTIFGLALLAFALARRNQSLQRVALGVFVIVTLFSIPAYLTGEPAEDLVKGLPGTAETIVEQHEDAGGAAFTGMIALGVVALAGLILFRGTRPLPVSYAVAVSLGSLVVSGMMGWTANLGGQIRHTEIRSGAPELIQPHHDSD